MSEQNQDKGQSQALVKGPAARMDALKSYFGNPQVKGTLAAVAPKHLTAERLMKIATTAASRNPTLLECTPSSVLCALIDCATLGLEPSTPLGLAYLVGYKNSKTGKTDCQLIVGYKGFVQLAYQSGDVSSIYAHEICEHDEWDYELGTNKRLFHKPAMGDRGPIVAFYAVVKLQHGGTDFAIMSVNEVRAIQQASPSGGSDAWKSHFGEMGKKTAIRRLMKTTPMSTERLISKAVAQDEDADRGNMTARIVDVDVNVLPPDPDDPQPTANGAKSRGDALADKLKNDTASS